MRLFTLFLLLVLPSVAISQSTSPIEFKDLPEQIKVGESFRWMVVAEGNASVELAIFSDHYLGFQANAQLTRGTHEYTITTDNWPVGKYFVLAKGANIHVQGELLVIKP